jgi:hypothetical protein
MDQNLLVTSGQALVRRLDDTPASPRFAMWVNFSDGNRWRLWLVPSKAVKDKLEFYKMVANTIHAHEGEMPGLDVGNVEFVPDDRPLVKDIAKLIREPGLARTDMSGSAVNGTFVPEGVLLRSNL